jgi:hypothetical protein
VGQEIVELFLGDFGWGHGTKDTSQNLPMGNFRQLYD